MYFHAIEVVTAFRVYGAIDETICASGIIAIMNLSVDPDNMMRLREAGANEGANYTYDWLETHLLPQH